MKRLLLLFAVAFTVINFAQTPSMSPILDIEKNDRLTIDQVVTDTRKIKVGNRVIGEGEKFYANENIEWVKNDDCIIVLNKRTKETYIISATEYKHYKSSSIYDWYVKKNHLDDKGGKKDTDMMTKILSERQFMTLDTLRIKSRLPLEYGRGYTIREINSTKKYEVPRDAETNEIVITLDYLKKRGYGRIVNVPLTFEVVYWRDQSSFTLTKFMTIEYIPY